MTSVPGALAAAALPVMRYGLTTCFVWVGVLKFQDYEIENAEPLVAASPLRSCWAP